MSRHKLTFCRICEPSCALQAVFDDHQALVGLEPARDHPAGGLACHKGLSFLEIHRDPDRVNAPQRRLNVKVEPQGEFVDVTWDAAMEDIGTRIRAIRSKHGPNAVGIYLGNPFVFNSAAVAYVGQFQESLDTQMRFSGSTQDTSNKGLAYGQIYGSPNSFLIPDLYHTEYLLCLGANPKVSRWTYISSPNDWDTVKNIVSRGGKVRFVNPRKTESSSSETGPTILIRPATDVYFIAAVLHEISVIRGFNNTIVERYAKNIDVLRDFVSRYPAERVAGITGVDSGVIKEIASELVTARSAAVYLATGVNQSRQGVLCVWLVEMLNLVTGNAGRTGGTIKTGELISDTTPSTGRTEVKTSIGSFYLTDPIGFSALPGAVLGDLIDSGDIRAMIVLAGNPLITVGGGEKLRAAFQKLDFLVSVDIYRNLTGELSDYVLPSVDWLERPDINLIGSGMQSIPYIKYTEAMVPATAERRHDWWILARLAQVIGLPSPLDVMDPESAVKDILDGMLTAGGFSLDQLKAEPCHALPLAATGPEAFFQKCLVHPDGKIDCAPAAFVDSGLFARCEAIFAELTNEPADTMKMISLRTPYTQNSWLANSATFRKGKNAANPLHIREDDAAARGLIAGESVCISNSWGTTETIIIIDNDLAPSTVAMTHGFGQGQAFALTTARLRPGANCNALMPTGLDSFEPLSHMSWMSGVPVKVERLKAGIDKRNASNTGVENPAKLSGTGRRDTQLISSI